MTEIKLGPSIGESPEIRFIEKLNHAFMNGDTDYLAGVISEDISWHIIGDKTITGKTDFLNEIRDMTEMKVEVMYIDQIIVQGNKGAASGSMRMPDGSKYAFADIYEFTDLVKSISSFIIALKKD